VGSSRVSHLSLEHNQKTYSECCRLIFLGLCDSVLLENKGTKKGPERVRSPRKKKARGGGGKLGSERPLEKQKRSTSTEKITRSQERPGGVE